MNKQGPNKISWTDYTWNPIKGLCPVGCWYCYARRIYERFGYMDKFDDDEFPMYKDTIFWAAWDGDSPMKVKKPRKIFICSTIEIFHPKVDKSFRDCIFEVIQSCPQHTFQILTKLPQNIDRPIPDNVWLGVSVTGNTTEDFTRAAVFGYESRKAKVQFISYEPILEQPIHNIPNVDWIILGRLTGHGHKHDPKREWIENLFCYAGLNNTPIFMKNNLKDIWGEPLIQEFPEPKSLGNTAKRGEK